MSHKIMTEEKQQWAQLVLLVFSEIEVLDFSLGQMILAEGNFILVMLTKSCPEAIN